MSADHPVSGKPDVILIDSAHPVGADVSPATVGGKAFGLLRMARAGIRVPPGFVLGTGCSRDYFARDNRLSESVLETIGHHVHALENLTLKGFGSKRNPLLVSVRSGAPVSMPGMMETLLNIGLNDETVSGLIRATGNPRLARDSYRRLIQAYAEVVHRVPPAAFDAAIANCLQEERVKSLDELSSGGLRKLGNDFKFVFRDCTGKEFPQDPWKQLHRAIAAVFASWNSERAETYRSLNSISAEPGTACLIQAMVFGNAGGTSGSGVGFTRNPANGSNELYVDYLANAQGEDIVSGRHDVHDAATVQQRFPAVFRKLAIIKDQLEGEFRNVQDFEFTVQEGELYMLQTRDGKRTPLAALIIAVALFDEGRIDAGRALALLDGVDLDNLCQRRLRQDPGQPPIAAGTPASTGVATGVIALDEDRARQLRDRGEPVVLVRSETSTDDIGAMHLADAVVTATGGRTSHAAVVARQLGIVCVVGCRTIQVDTQARCLYINDQVYAEGGWLTVDADHGHIHHGRLEVETCKPEALLQRVREWREALAEPGASMSRAGTGS